MPVTMLLLVACGSGDGGVQPGSALSPVGLQGTGPLTFGAPSAGSMYYLSFPMLTNRSSRPVTVTGFRVDRASGNVRVLGYVVHSTAQFGGRLLFAYDPTRPEPSFDFEAAPSLRLPYVIPGHGRSQRYAMARVRVTAYPLAAHVQGCTVFYRLGSSSRRYMQMFDCTYQIGKDVPKLVARPSSVVVINSYGSDITVVGCPLCKGRGAVIEADPSTRNGGGGYFGWKVGKSDPISADVIVGGHRVHCSPPQRSPPELTYNITTSGRCVVLHG
jgi:hypothetical protein